MTDEEIRKLLLSKPPMIQTRPGHKSISFKQIPEAAREDVERWVEDQGGHVEPPGTLRSEGLRAGKLTPTDVPTEGHVEVPFDALEE